MLNALEYRLVIGVVVRRFVATVPGLVARNARMLDSSAGPATN